MSALCSQSITLLFGTGFVGSLNTWSVVSDFELLARLDAIALADFRGEK